MRHRRLNLFRGAFLRQKPRRPTAPRRRLSVQRLEERLPLAGPGEEFRISHTTSPPVGFFAEEADVAHNTQDNEYLVVWSQNLTTDGDGDREIFGRRYDGRSGAALTEAFRITDHFPEGGANSEAVEPTVAYNSTANRYLLVFRGDIRADNHFELFAAPLLPSGALEGTVVEITSVGPGVETGFKPETPDVVYNPTNDEFLVTWWGDTDTLGENEIFARRLTGSGGLTELPTRVSQMGDATNPAVAHNPLRNEYLILWDALDTDGGQETFGQRLNAAGAQIGADDFRVSQMDHFGNSAGVAYNPVNDEYLAVWYGREAHFGGVPFETEIFAQRLAFDGSPLGGELLISDLGGGVGNSGDFQALLPEVAYNRVAHEYLVVWHGDDNTGALANDEFEIFAQRLDATTGAEIGFNDFRLSDMGPDGDPDYDARDAAVVYNRTSHRWMVVWEGDDNRDPLVDDVQEIFAQHLGGGSGAEVGPNDFRVSFAAPSDDGVPDSFAALAFNHHANEYLAVWSAEVPGAGDEIFGQRIDAATGEQIGRDIQISHGLSASAFDARSPDVVYNPDVREYLVVWSGDTIGGGLADNEFEIYGQRLLGATGEQVGEDDFRISPGVNPPGDPDYDAVSPSVAYSPISERYMVVYSVEFISNDLDPSEPQIVALPLEGATGRPAGDLQLVSVRDTDDLPTFIETYGAFEPDIVHGPAPIGGPYADPDEFLVVWRGDRPEVADDEMEVYAQRLSREGTKIGRDIVRVSRVGPDDDARFNARAPSVAFNSTDAEYLVVWSGDDLNAGLADQEVEIFGERMNHGLTDGRLNFRISHSGADGDRSTTAFAPAAGYDARSNEYLVLWAGNSSVRGQRLNSFGQFVGPHNFQVSGDPPQAVPGVYVFSTPALAYDGAGGALAVWHEGAFSFFAPADTEVYGAFLDASARLPDVVGRTPNGVWWLVRNHGAHLENMPYGFWAENAGWRDVQYAHLNGDDLPDVIGRAAGGDWWAGMNDPGSFEADGALTGAGFNFQPFGQWNEAAGWNDVYVADFTGDGLADAIGRTDNGQWWLGRNTGVGFDNQPFGFWAAIGWLDVRFADFTADGLPDVLGRTRAGDWWLGHNTPAGLVNRPYGLWSGGVDWQDVHAADVTGEGFIDLIGRTPGGSVWVGVNDGLGLTNEPWAGLATDWRDVSVTDIDGDGRADYVGRSGAGQWLVGLSDGERFNLGGYGFWSGAADWRDVQVLDVNSDGLGDVLGRTSGGEWWAGVNDGTQFVNALYGAWAPLDWRAVNAAELHPATSPPPLLPDTAAELSLAAELARLGEADDEADARDRALAEEPWLW